MADWFLRRAWRRHCHRTAGRVTSALDADRLGRSALVFSPHQDDETLGCGGTIIKKRAAGADVKIVFMTDGRQSHQHIIPTDELVAIRRREAIAAGRVLGVAEGSIIFLDYEDGTLCEHHAAAVGRVAAILDRLDPREIFVPYRREPTSDHEATAEIVLAALKARAPGTRKHGTTVYEYPVWFWFHWPWIGLWQGREGLTRFVLKNTLAARLGLRLSDFRSSVYVGDVLDRKREALTQHASQVTQLIDDPRWKTLGDLARGDFLDSLLQDHEIFRLHEVPLGGDDGNRPAATR